MRRSLMLLALAALALPHPVTAQFVMPHTIQSLSTCAMNEEIYTAASTDAPAPVAHSFGGRGKEVSFRTCRDGDGITHFFIRKPRPNRNAICRVVEDELFPADDSDFVIVDVLYDGTNPSWYFELHGWTFRPPAAWSEMGYRARHRSLALVTADAATCPPTNDARYIPVSGTDGLIKTFFRRWRAITASPEDFDRALAPVPVLPVPPFSNDPDRVRHAVHTQVFDRHQDVEGIRCDEQELSIQGGCQAFVGDFSIFFDVTDHGLEITGIRENPVA